ncbi:MAG: hypothetical protein JW958_07570 [Candidatus Eisenbacteria bacterium]|nr:hypothetical protein [Candidatus Eisenbacteria bacterium]
MKRTFCLAALLALPLLSCGTKDADTLVGSGLVDNRSTAMPRSIVLRDLTADTYFEASLEPGEQPDLLVGRRRKFGYRAAVYFSLSGFNEPTDSLVEARLTGIPWSPGDGAGEVRIGRILEDWTEKSETETLETADDFDVIFAGGIDAALPLEWARGWIDSSAGNNGLLLSPIGDEESLLRFPSMEADTASPGEPFRLLLTYRDTLGADTTVTRNLSLDRFYAFKFDPASYVVENETSDTLLVGQREAVTNQAIFQFLFPDSLGDVTINRAELVLTVARTEIEEESLLVMNALRVLNDELESDSIAISAVIYDDEKAIGPSEPGDTVEIELTDLARTWITGGERNPAVLVRPDTDRGRDRHAVFFSREGAYPPRLRILYTPLRPEED